MMIKNLNNFYGYAYGTPNIGGSVWFKDGNCISEKDLLIRCMYKLLDAHERDRHRNERKAKEFNS